MATRLTSLSDPRSTIYTPLTGARLSAKTDPRSTLFTASGPDHTDAVKEKIESVGVETAPTTVSVGKSQVELNPLDNYRSVTYNFILAALSPDMMKDPNQEWRKKPLKYIIASTRGKGVNAIQSSVTAPAAAGKAINQETGEEYTPVSSPQKQVDVGKLISAFNSESPGSYDLWIDNVDVDTIMAPTEQSGPALGTKVSFEVYEPYSINGLIEALHVGARAAGWDGYLNATFLLKIEFVGYPDSEPLSTVKAKIINEKFIPILITGTDIDVTEQGTRYKVKAIPVNEVAHSNFNRLTAARQMTGGTVGEVIDDLVKGLNEGIKDRAKKEKEDSSIHDTYEIIFPKRPDSGEAIDLKSKNDISKAKISQPLKESNVYQFKDLKDKQDNPKGSDPDKKYDPSNMIVQFPVDADIVDIITAVIRDSHYLKGILEKIKDKAKEGDGMIEYFQVIVNALPLKFDPTNNIHCYNYQYIVMPYKVHASKLLGQQYNKFEPKQFNNLVKRRYDYLYGGKNVDVLNFKLNFNNLFFQAANANQGNKPVSEHANAAAPSGADQTKQPKDQAKGTSDSAVNTQGTRVSTQASGNDGRAGAAKDDPYWQLTYNAHQAILESVSMLTGQLDIMGDPYYLCTSGMGNYIPKTKDIATTDDGEANFTQAPCVIKLNFRNPIDIGPFNEGGFLKFQSTLVPFSGLYQVINCHSKFSDGQFKQTLKLIRYSGQLAEDDPSPPKTAPDVKREKDPKNIVVKDSAPADVQSAGIRVPTLNLAKMQAKGLPSLGFPGELNQLMAGGLKVPGLSNFLSDAGGALSGALSGVQSAAEGLLGNAAGVFGGGGLPSLSGLAGQASSLLGNPLSAVGNLANGAISGVGNLISNPSSLLSQAPGISQGLNALNQAGSGLGINVGASLSGLNPLASGVRLDASAIGGVVNQIKDAGASIVDASSNMIANVTSINGSNLGLDQIGASLSDAASKGLSPALALQGAGALGLKLPNVSGLNPAALAGKLGIDTSQLSGLGGKLTADLTKQLKSISEEIPENVDLGDAKKLGFSLGSLSKSTLQNIPAFPPLNIKAPDIEKSVVDQFIDNPGDTKLLAQFGLTPAMGAFNPSGALSNLNSLKSSLAGAIPSAGSLMASAQAGFGSSITSQLGSLTGGSPLDKLNIPSVGNLTAQASNLIPNLGSLQSAATNLTSGLTIPKIG
jgi:hypothetical protein